MKSFRALGIAAAVCALTVAGCGGESAGSGSDSGAAGTAGSGSYGDCTVTSKAGSVTVKPVESGTLTVGVILPNPGNWNGENPNAIRSGFEYCFAADIANAAGLQTLKLKPVAFEALVAGQARGYDLAMSGIFITDKRKQAVDMSDSYYRTTSAFLVKKGSGLDQSGLKSARLAVYNGSIQQTWVADTLRPSKPARAYQSTPEMVAAVAAGQVDAALLDTPLMLTAAQKSNGALKVVGQVDVGGDSGAVLPKGSPNTQAVNTVIDQLKAADTFAELEKQYLVPAFGANPADLPKWTP